MYLQQGNVILIKIYINIHIRSHIGASELSDWRSEHQTINGRVTNMVMTLYEIYVLCPEKRVLLFVAFFPQIMYITV